MKKYYLASKFERQKEMRCYRQMLNDLGLIVTSRWLDEESSDNDMGYYPLYASHDLYDLEKADVLVTFTDPVYRRRVRQSKNVEFGYAVAMGLDLVLIGPRENIFHYLPKVTQYDNFKQWITLLMESIPATFLT